MGRKRAQPDAVLEAVMDRANEALGVEVSVLQVVDPRDPSQLVTVATRGLEDIPAAAIGRTSVNVGLNGEAVLRGEPVTVDDYQRFPQGQPQVRASGLKVAMSAPVRESGVIAGVLLVSSRKRRRPFSASEQQALLQVAEQASLAISYARRLSQRGLAAV
jgi:GAF domain-containing protein